jgi:hypothetical protein
MRTEIVDYIENIDFSRFIEVEFFLFSENSDFSQSIYKTKDLQDVDDLFSLTYSNGQDVNINYKHRRGDKVLYENNVKFLLNEDLIKTLGIIMLVSYS